MSIVAYTGLPGSGKSYSVVRSVILPSLKDGRRVVTNIPLRAEVVDRDIPEAKVVQWDSETFRDPQWFTAIQPGDVVVLDELWRVWPSGLKANQAEPGHKELLAEHRHMVSAEGWTTRIVLVTQDLSQVAAWVRALVEETYHHRKMSSLGLSKAYRTHVFGGAVTGQRPPKGQEIGVYTAKYDKAIYQYYRSASKSRVDDVGDETKADGRGVVWRSPGFLGGAVFALLLLLWSVNQLRAFVGGDSAPERPAASEPARTAPAEHSVRDAEHIPPPRPALPQWSREWRLAGWIDVGAGPLAILMHKDGRQRYILGSLCTVEPDGRVCRHDGALVTSWTGAPPASDRGWFPVAERSEAR
jgi:zona occludens toxin